MAVGLDVDERNRIIGDNLRKYRLLKGMTQDELADGLCSVSQLSKVENGKTYVKRTMLKQMADRLGVTVERIESVDALLEELTETLQLAKDAHSAKNFPIASQLVMGVIEKSKDFSYEELSIDAVLTWVNIKIDMNQHEEIIEDVSLLLENPNLAPHQRIFALCYLGNAFDRCGNVHAAFDCYIRADEEYEASYQEDARTRFNILFFLSKCNSIMGSYRNAIRHAEKAEKLAKVELWHLRRIRAICLRAIPLRRLGYGQQAELLYKECLKEAQDNSYLLDVAIISNNLGEIYQDRGEFGQASIYFNRARAIYELIDDEMYKCEPLLHLAQIAHQERDHETSRNLLNLVFNHTEKIGLASYKVKARAFALLGKIELSEENVEGYLEYSLQALDLYSVHHVYQAAYDIAIELADFFYNNGNSRSVEMYRQAVEYNKAIIQLRG